MSRLAWTTKITALCEVSSCVNSSVFVFLAPSRIIFSIFWDEKQEISLVWPDLEFPFLLLFHINFGGVNIQPS